MVGIVVIGIVGIVIAVIVIVWVGKCIMDIFLIDKSVCFCVAGQILLLLYGVLFIMWEILFTTFPRLGRTGRNFNKVRR